MWKGLSPDWLIKWVDLIALALMALVMKWTVLWRHRPSPMTPQAQLPKLYIYSPLLAPNSLERLRPLSAFPRFFLRAVGCFAAFLIYCRVYWWVVGAFHLRGWLLGYLAAPAVFLMTEMFIAVVTMLWLPQGSLLPVLHRNPVASRSVAEFWGRRWNLWISEWFRLVIFRPLRRRPVLALWFIFFLSGVMHEYVLNLTLWLVTGTKLFGTMMIYFLLQPAGILLERRFPNGLPKVLFTWLVVFGPAPLVFHESMLRTLHLWPASP